MERQWMSKVTPKEWSDMAPYEREMIIYSILGIEKKELAQMVAETEVDSPHQPNAFFVSYKSLAKMPVKIKHIRLGGHFLKQPVDLTIIPMDADENHFKVAVVDPWDPRWEHLFYS
jgi:hypothetical protein